MAMHRPVVLLTGFGPFPGVPANATSVLVPRIAAAAQRAFPGTRIVVEILPTEWHAGIERAHALYRHHAPAVALHFGVSGRARGFEIEARGLNRSSFIFDAAGRLPDSDCIVDTAPHVLASNLPVHHIVTRLRRRRLPAFISRDAGGYLCNALMYHSLDIARRNGAPIRNGFVHLPSSLVDERNPYRGPHPRCPLDWRGTIEGGLEILAATLGTPTRPLADQVTV